MEVGGLEIHISLPRGYRFPADNISANGRTRSTAYTYLEERDEVYLEGVIAVASRRSCFKGVIVVAST